MPSGMGLFSWTDESPGIRRLRCGCVRRLAVVANEAVAGSSRRGRVEMRDRRDRRKGCDQSKRQPLGQPISEATDRTAIVSLSDKGSP